MDYSRARLAFVQGNPVNNGLCKAYRMTSCTISHVWAVLGLLSLSCNQIYCISILLVKDTVLSGVEFQAMIIS